MFGIGEGSYSYIYGEMAGRSIVLGPYNSGDRQIDIDRDKMERSTIYVLPTRDRGRATQMIRKQLMDKGRNMDSVFARMKHSFGMGGQQRPAPKPALDFEGDVNKIENEEDI